MAAGTQNEEKREFPRSSCRIGVSVHAPSEEALLCTQALNLSASGAFIRANKLFPVGTAVRIEIQPFGTVERVLVDGVVSWISARGTTYPRGMGLHFSPDDLRGRARVGRLVRNLSEHRSS